MMGLDFGRQLPVFGAFEKPPQLMQIASHEVVGHLDTNHGIVWVSIYSNSNLERASCEAPKVVLSPCPQARQCLRPRIAM